MVAACLSERILQPLCDGMFCWKGASLLSTADFMAGNAIISWLLCEAVGWQVCPWPPARPPGRPAPHTHALGALLSAGATRAWDLVSRQRLDR